MDFVASRQNEKRYGWRNRVGQFLKHHGVTVFDPWNKPDIRGLYEYGKEDEKSIEVRKEWSFSKGSNKGSGLDIGQKWRGFHHCPGLARHGGYLTRRIALSCRLRRDL